MSSEFSWSDDELQFAPAMLNHGEGDSGFCEASSSSNPSNALFHRFVGMGFADKHVTRALEENGNADEGLILEAIQTIAALENSPTRNQDFGNALIEAPDAETVVQADSDFDLMSDNSEESLFDDLDSYPEKQECLLSASEKLSLLEDMKFPREEALIAIERCGPEASMEVIADCIFAAQLIREDDAYNLDPLAEQTKPDFKKRKMGYGASCSKQKRGLDEENSVHFPNPMVGFGVKPYPIVRTRRLPEEAAGPPYFYYENVALAPKGVWSSISRFLYHVEPEFVDSKYFCAANRKRGYVHNLPIDGRFHILPLPRMTVQEALPMTATWWPSWDQRTKLNCLQTSYASAELTKRILLALKACPEGENPPLHVQKNIMKECKRWNLVWVGRNKLARLEPHEVEMILGYPAGHTRGGGISATDRYKSLGNSFQVDTVAYHLSVLKALFPDGIRVLSLFTGIGGGEVALHRLGIRLKLVVSVEISEVNQSIVNEWWEQHNLKQQGTLLHFGDVEDFSNEKIKKLIGTYGGFDLVIGGSPCNNLAGGNRHSRDGLEGKESSLFFEYTRILEAVRSFMMAGRR